MSADVNERMRDVCTTGVYFYVSTYDPLRRAAKIKVHAFATVIERLSLIMNSIERRGFLVISGAGEVHRACEDKCNPRTVSGAPLIPFLGTLTYVLPLGLVPQVIRFNDDFLVRREAISNWVSVGV
jgi:hypothetical protein